MTITVKQPTEEELRDFLMRKFLEEQLNKQNTEHVGRKVNKYKQRLMKVTPALFRQFLSDKGVSLRCPSCGSDELSVPESITMQTERVPGDLVKPPQNRQEEIAEFLSNSYVSYITLGDERYVAGLRKSYYQVHCINCGHLSLYRSATVLNWLENLEKVSEKE